MSRCHAPCHARLRTEELCQPCLAFSFYSRSRARFAIHNNKNNRSWKEVKKPLTSLTTLIGARQQTFTTSSIPGGTSRRLPQQNSHHAARWGRRARDCFPPVRAGPLPSSRSPPRRVTDRRTRQTDGWQMCDTPTYGAASRRMCDTLCIQSAEMISAIVH